MKKCSVDGCNSKHYGKGYCQKHYQQMKRHGKILNRTIYDPNEIIIHEDYAEIVLYNKQCEEVARTLIDLEDMEKAKNYKWGLSMGYARSYSGTVFLHRIVMDCPDDMVIDHINHNPLDNRKSNLRICTQQQNIMNKNRQYNNTSGHTGVYFQKCSGKWCAYITKFKYMHLGSFDTKEEAIEARRQAELEYFGEYRNQDED